MPLPPFPGPLTVSATLPSCATAFLYQLGELYYYATEDCATGATGYGVLDSLIAPAGCQGEECTAGSVVNPTILLAMLESNATNSVAQKKPTVAQNSPAFAQNSPAFAQNSSKLSGKHPYGKSKKFLKQLKAQLEHFKRRKTNSNDVADRRHQLVTNYLDVDPDSGTLTNLDRIFSQRKEIRDMFLDAIAKELRSVRVGAGDAMSNVFLVDDQDFETDTIVSSALSVLFNKTGGDASATPTDPNFTQGGVTSPYVKLTTKGNPHAAPPTIFFRLQHIALGSGATHHIGQQVLEADMLPVGTTEPAIPSNKIKTAAWVDRHAHFHVIKATPDGGVETDYLVYSAEDISAREFIV